MPFDTVASLLPCQRCLQEFSTFVEFETSKVANPSSHVLNETTPLTPNTCYRGSADAYCVNCAQTWRRDEVEANFEEFIRALKEGRADAFRAGENLTVEAALSLQTVAVSSAAADSFPQRLADLGIQVSNWSWPNHRESVGENLVARGWSLGLELKVNPVVCIDSEQRVSVREMSESKGYTWVHILDDVGDWPPNTLTSVDDMVEGLSRFEGQRLKAIYAHWYAHDDSASGWYYDGSIVLEFERDRLEIWSPGPDACFTLNPPSFDPAESFDYDGAQLVWRRNPWPELKTLQEMPLLSLTILLHGHTPLSLRLCFDSGPLCIFADNDEAKWVRGLVPPWQCQWNEIPVF